MFIDAVDLELFVPGGRGTIYYTLDGKPADNKSPRYTKPLTLTDSTTVNAFTAWDSGRESAPLQVTLSKVTPQHALAAGSFEPGLHYEYYEGRWDTLPDFDQYQPARRGTSPGFDLDATAHREENFAVRFSGVVDVPRDGVYTFYVASDDGSQLYIDAELVVDNDGLHAMKEESGSVALASGKHAITVTFFERGGAQRLQVSYTGPQTVKQPVAPSMLFRRTK